MVSQIPLIVVAAFTILTARRALLAQAGVNMLGVGTEVARAVDHQLMAWREDIVSTSQLPEIVAYATNPTDAAAKIAVKALKAEATKTHHESIALVNRQGKIILSSVDADVNTDVSFRPYFLEAMKGDGVHLRPLGVGHHAEAIHLHECAGPRRQQPSGRRRPQPLRPLRSLGSGRAGGRAVGAGTVAMLLDNQGIRIAHSASKGNREGVVKTLLYRAISPVTEETTKQIVAEKRFGQATAERVNVLPLPDVAAALRPSEATTFEAAADNSTVRHQSAAVPLKNKPWHLVLQAPQPSFTRAAVQMTQVGVAASAGFGLLTVLAAYFIARGITAPLLQLADVADRISLGELNAKIRINRRDEVGDLAEALRRMQVSLQTAIERLRAKRNT